MKGPLAGIRVLDFSENLPGPYATQVLVTMGAEVVKVERPTGDGLSQVRFGEEAVGAAYRRLNAGKEIIALDLKAPEARGEVEALLAEADIVVSSFRPGVMARLGLGYEAVKARHPGIIYCALTGDGETGERRLMAGHDLNFVAASGLLGEMAAPGVLPVQIADVGGALWAVIAIMGALRERDRTGVGRFLDLSLTEAAASFVALPGGAGRGPLSGRWPCYRTYRCADGGWVALAALEPVFWRRFCAQVGREEWLARAFDIRLGDELEALFGTKAAAEWGEVFEGVDACFSVVAVAEGAAGGELEPWVSPAFPNEWLRKGGLPGKPGGDP